MPYICYSIRCGVCDSVSSIRIGGDTATKPENSPLVVVIDPKLGLQVGFQCPRCPKRATQNIMYLPVRPA